MYCMFAGIRTVYLVVFFWKTAEELGHRETEASFKEKQFLSLFWIILAIWEIMEIFLIFTSFLYLLDILRQAILTGGSHHQVSYYWLSFPFFRMLETFEKFHHIFQQFYNSTRKEGREEGRKVKIFWTQKKIWNKLGY